MFKKLLILTLGLLMTTTTFASEFDELLIQAQNGDKWSQALVANYHHDNGDYQKRFYWMRKLANQGMAITQFNLAIMYKKGEGVAKIMHWQKNGLPKFVKMANKRLASNIRF